MKHWFRILVALALLWSASVSGQMLNPLIPHNTERTAVQAVSELRTSVHWNRFVMNVANYQRWTFADAHAFVNDAHLWTIRPFAGWFASDGVYYRNGSWHVGTIYRETVPGEQFVFTAEGRPVFSTRCGNPVQPATPIVEKTKRCREYHYEGSATFSAPVIIVTGTGFDSGPIVSTWHGFGYDCISTNH